MTLLGFLCIVEDYLIVYRRSDDDTMSPNPSHGQSATSAWNKLTKSLQVLLEVITGNHFPISVQISWHVGCCSAALLTASEWWRAPPLTATCAECRTCCQNQIHFNPITSHFPPSVNSSLPLLFLHIEYLHAYIMYKSFMLESAYATYMGLVWVHFFY